MTRPTSGCDSRKCEFVGDRLLRIAVVARKDILDDDLRAVAADLKDNAPGSDPEPVIPGFLSREFFDVAVLGAREIFDAVKNLTLVTRGELLE